MTTSTATKEITAFRTDSQQIDLHVGDRLREMIDLHFHPEHGTAYWLERQKTLGFDVRDRVRGCGDLTLLGTMQPSDLADRSVWDFVPRELHAHRSRYLVAETGGTSGPPTPAVYLESEFHEAFVEPFVCVARRLGFPRGVQWLFVGPSGPHIIGKASCELARRWESPNPWSVDFDPRWAKKLVPDSLAAQRYLQHVVDQALAVIRRERVEVLFTTPPVSHRLAEVLTDDERESFRAVHYGGMPVTAREINGLREIYPKAIHLSGYGNTLFGCALETADDLRQTIDYFPAGTRLLFDVIRDKQTERSGGHLPRGPLVFHRFDRSMLLVGMLERDWAELVPPSRGALEMNWSLPGIRDPGPTPQAAANLKVGIY
jgi:thienamycin biosynthesis protein ThnN